MKFKSFKIVKICLLIKVKFLAKKFLYNNFILQPLFKSAQYFYQKGEGSGTETGAGSTSGSVLVTNGSGRPKNILIRIRNTDQGSQSFTDTAGS